jgi:hypothetical protein
MGNGEIPFALRPIVVRGENAMQIIEPQYFWGIMFSWLHSLLGGSWRIECAKDEDLRGRI